MENSESRRKMRLFPMFLHRLLVVAFAFLLIGLTDGYNGDFDEPVEHIKIGMLCLMVVDGKNRAKFFFKIGLKIVKRWSELNEPEAHAIQFAWLKIHNHALEYWYAGHHHLFPFRLCCVAVTRKRPHRARPRFLQK